MHAGGLGNSSLKLLLTPGPHSLGRPLFAFQAPPERDECFDNAFHAVAEFLT